MFHFLISIVAFIVAISILVVVHEFGHFWVARRFGIKVERFSIGFGKPFYRWYDRLGTEYVLSMIPLGGYVAMFGEKGETVSPADRLMAFESKPVFARMLVILAGPAFNFLFAIFAYWFVFLLGISVLIPVLGKVPADSLAGQAGLRENEEIVSIEDHPTPSWESVSVELLRYVGEDKSITLSVKNRTTQQVEQKVLDMTHWEADSSEPNWLASLGFIPMDPMPAIVGKVMPDYPAEGSGMKEGDKILAIDGKPVYSRTDVITLIQERPAQEVELTLLRDKQKKQIRLETVARTTDSDKKEGFIGIEFKRLDELPKDYTRIERYGLWGSLKKAVYKTGEFSILTLEVLKKMIAGKMSVRHINGPLVIADHAGRTAMVGFKKFLDFLGLISVSLGVINLLPIPLLDGGHLMYCFYEMLTGRRVPNLVHTVGLWLGGLLLVGFMMLAFYNDVLYFLR